MEPGRIFNFICIKVMRNFNAYGLIPREIATFLLGQIGLQGSDMPRLHRNYAGTDSNCSTYSRTIRVASSRTFAFLLFAAFLRGPTASTSCNDASILPSNPFIPIFNCERSKASFISTPSRESVHSHRPLRIRYNHSTSS